ncbi:hypothetical protein E1N52_41065 [Paraburkholderia guartelaensis]|uniref:Uncharacterized protein n=1 Tax=Paraburkholderia guartelaensis TaxID=2546446 RepID=A0A4R5L316_9BURK|nr:hypothetical protein [Paraburkholderia guartelaensis]TDG02175.1 hypothetical protein E1N52_41065 [Paraburkholderia guartelaensis]
MDDALDIAFWILMNLVVPILAPIGVLGLTRFSHDATAAKELMSEAVKDGQLYWSSMAICSSAVWELCAGLEDKHHAFPHALLQFFIVVFGLIGIASVLIVALTTLQGYMDRTHKAAAAATAVAAGTAAAAAQPAPAAHVPGAQPGNPGGNTTPPVVPKSAMVVVSIRLTALAAFLFAGLHSYMSTIPYK